MFFPIVGDDLQQWTTGLIIFHKVTSWCTVHIPRDLTTSPDPQGSALPRHGHRILLKTAQEKGATAVAGEEVEV